MTQEGFGQAYRQGFIRTVRLLRSRGASMEVAEDVAQTAWLRGLQKLDQLREEGAIVSWVNTIAINYQRRGAQHEARYQPLPDGYGLVEIDLAPLDTAKILNTCRPADRILFEHQLGGLTTEEMATKHRVSATAIRIRLLRARRNVRARLEDRRQERAAAR
jgi:DNA-directed RNA polymerase specialized sigma24 family protein